MANENVKSAQQVTSTKRVSKQDTIIRLLRRARGATLAEISKVTNWQEHSIRGFLSGTLKKRLALNLESEKSSKGVRRYRIVKNEPTVQTGEAA